MLFVIAGPSYVRKKTAVAHFMNLYSFQSIIPYTTKPYTHRVGETEGIQYHYVDEANRSDMENENFIYDTPFHFGQYQEKTLYGYKKDDIALAINSYSNFIIHVSVGNVKKIYEEFHEKYPDKLYFIFMNFESALTKDFFEKKQPKGASDAAKRASIKKAADKGSYDFERRFSHAKREVEFYKDHSEYFDSCVRSDKAYDICAKLEKEILPKIQVMPTSPDRIPGPLSDADIIYMCEKRRTDSLKVEVSGKQLPIEDIKKLLCGCGMHLTLSENIRVIKSNIRNNFIDMSLQEPLIKKTLSKLYPEKSIATGYMLKPHETILCTSEEYITVPRDVYAVVASKFSYSQLGLSVELATSIIQAGHEGRIHFQIKNNTKNYICLYPHIQVAQLIFFRTVQPTIAVYHERDPHLYDRESNAPISKFWEQNDALKKVKKPVANVLTKFMKGFASGIWAGVIGTIATLAGIIAFFDQIENCFINHIVPFFTSVSYVQKALLVAAFCAVLYMFIYFVGFILMLAFEKLVVLLKDHWRRQDG